MRVSSSLRAVVISGSLWAGSGCRFRTRAPPSSWRPSSSSSGPPPPRGGGPLNPRDEDSVRYYDLHGQVQFTTFGKLKEMAAEAKSVRNRDLIRVDYGSDVVADPTPTYRLLKPNELEALVRKNRHFRQHQFYQKVVEDKGEEEDDVVPEDAEVKAGTKRIHEKMAKLRVGVSEHDVDVAVVKIRKWLRSGNNFVNLTITSGNNGGKRSQEAKALEELVRSKLPDEKNEKNGLDLTKLTIKFSN